MTDTKDDIVAQHIGWLKQFVTGMTADNWRDMRERCERQLNELSDTIRALKEKTE